MESLPPSLAAALLASRGLNLIGRAALLALQLKHCRSDGGAEKETHHSHRVNHWEFIATAVRLPATREQVSPALCPTCCIFSCEYTYRLQLLEMFFTVFD